VISPVKRKIINNKFKKRRTLLLIQTSRMLRWDPVAIVCVRSAFEPPGSAQPDHAPESLSWLIIAAFSRLARQFTNEFVRLIGINVIITDFITGYALLVNWL
jgi:hypothetical protein